MTTKRELLSQIEEIGHAVQTHDLSDDELEDLAERFQGLQKTVEADPRSKHSVLELKGLGKEIWQDIDVDEYIRELRRSWR